MEDDFKSSSIESILDELLTLTSCSICFNSYDADKHIPISCPNFHFNCRNCLEQQREIFNKRTSICDGRLSLTCPFCRSEYDTKITKEKKVGGRDLARIATLLHTICKKYENEREKNKRRKKSASPDFPSQSPIDNDATPMEESMITEASSNNHPTSELVLPSTSVHPSTSRENSVSAPSLLLLPAHNSSIVALPYSPLYMRMTTPYNTDHESNGQRRRLSFTTINTEEWQNLLSTSTSTDPTPRSSSR